MSADLDDLKPRLSRHESKTTVLYSKEREDEREIGRVTESD